ncbi:MAG: hypothetical protein ACE144_20505 [Thermodesulfobacteriota bacterium]
MNDSEHATDKGVKFIVGVTLLLWLVMVFILGAKDAFVGPPEGLPLPVLAGFLTPILLFLVAFWTVGPFHDFAMSIDLSVMAGIQAWRLGGLGFIALYAYGVLPGLFAWPAGLGDMAIGLTAPLVILAIRRHPVFAAGRLFRVWNLLGILDLVVAVGLGALSSVLGIGISGEIAAFPMGRMPLVIVPTFLVPLFVMLHLASLLQARQLVVAGRVCSWTEPTIRCEPVAAVQKA